MPTLDRAVASLRVMGEDLQPSEVSALLGATPTVGYARGETLTSKRGPTRVARTGHWSLEATETTPADLDLQIMGLLSQLTSSPDAWSQLQARYEVDLFCGWFMGVCNEGTSLEVETLIGLGLRGIALSIDLYGSFDD